MAILKSQDYIDDPGGMAFSSPLFGKTIAEGCLEKA
jgi:hypothetical protein